MRVRVLSSSPAMGRANETDACSSAAARQRMASEASSTSSIAACADDAMQFSIHDTHAGVRAEQPRAA